MFKHEEVKKKQFFLWEYNNYNVLQTIGFENFK